MSREGSSPSVDDNHTSHVTFGVSFKPSRDTSSPIPTIKACTASCSLSGLTDASVQASITSAETSVPDDTADPPIKERWICCDTQCKAGALQPLGGAQGLKHQTLGKGAAMPGGNLCLPACDQRQWRLRSCCGSS